MRILFVGGDGRYAESTTAALTSEGFHVSLCASGEEGIELAQHLDFDAIVVNSELRDISGRRVVTKLRATSIALPIVILLDEATPGSRVSALGEGADDCLSKPFHCAELGARLRAVIRRSKSHHHPVIRIGALEIDTENREVRASGQLIHLTPTEYRMFEVLALRKGQTVRRTTMFETLYDGQDDPEEKVIDVFMCKIRKKIAAATYGETYISTAWGDGYKLHEPRLNAA